MLKSRGRPSGTGKAFILGMSPISSVDTMHLLNASQTPRFCCTRTSYGFSVGSLKPSPQSMLSRGQAICTHASMPCDKASSLAGDTSAGGGKQP